MLTKTNCTVCSSPTREIIDLGSSPPANTFVSGAEQKHEIFPLVLEYCSKCSCLQLRDCLSEQELYSEYTYITPKTESINFHYKFLTDYLLDKGFIGPETNCLEIGSNNGDFLNFIKPKVKTVIGIDAAENIVAIANSNNINTLKGFFSLDFAKKNKDSLKSSDLIIARHMFAHNPDPKIIFSGIDYLLEKEGIVLIENAYAFDTLQKGEFDQIYHEHMFYYSAKNMNALLDLFSFELKDILFSELHGGSIIFICGRKNVNEVSPNVAIQIKEEEQLLENDKIFTTFKEGIKKNRLITLEELDKDLKLGKTIGAYGAPAKAFTLFSFYNLDSSVIKFCVDTTPTKIGKIFPKFNIPVISEKDLRNMEYDTLLVTAWNYRKDILAQSKSLFKKGTKLIFPLPFFNTHIV